MLAIQVPTNVRAASNACSQLGVRTRLRVEKLLSQVDDDAPNVNARRMTSRMVGNAVSTTGSFSTDKVVAFCMRCICCLATAISASFNLILPNVDNGCSFSWSRKAEE